MGLNFRLEVVKEDEQLELYPSTYFTEVESYEGVWGKAEIEVRVPIILKDKQTVPIGKGLTKNVNIPYKISFVLDTESEFTLGQQVQSFGKILGYQLTYSESTGNNSIELYYGSSKPVAPIIIKLEALVNSKEAV